MQVAKIIDVKKSFVPIDPNAFPENYHTTQKEDQPEDPAPVVPYMGANFLATSYGFRSFFGTNYKAAVASLAAQAEHVFLYQNLAYSNTLIALCDTGIYAKDANTGGAWTQLIALAAPAGGIYYEWFFEIIKNKLYMFRGNGAAYYVIQTNIVQPLGIEVLTVVPTFITIGAQLGLFKLGSRLGFWDAENAVAWSSPDDLSDFTPSVLNGANVTTFTSVTGKISAIRTHGKHAIVYATKSITLLNTQPTDTFLVKAEPIIGAGVPYNRQSVVGSPSTMHFCYASTGIYRIENGRAEAIIPEVFDFLKGYTKSPVYLKLLNNRYLCFELLDENVANGIPHFSNVYYPESTLTFPGYTSMEDMQEVPAEDINWCQFMQQIDTGNTEEMQALASSQIPDKMPGTTASPIWKAYISPGGAVPDPIVFSDTPCGAVRVDTGAKFQHSPTGSDGAKTTTWTQDSSGKTAKLGSDVYLDGKWTMERFIQYQTAIWERAEAGMEKFISAVASKNETATKVENDVSVCVPSDPAYTLCQLGRYPSRFTPPMFAYNVCSFWLTRFCLEAVDIVNKSKNVVTCNDGSYIVPINGYFVKVNGNRYGQTWATEDQAVQGYATLVNDGAVYTKAVYTAGGSTMNTDAAGQQIANSSAAYKIMRNGADIGASVNIVAEYTALVGYQCYQVALGGMGGNPYPTVGAKLPAGHYKKTQVQNSFNVATSTGDGIWAAETAYCEIVGWNYTKTNGAAGTQAVAGCSSTGNMHPNAGSSASGPVRTADPTQDVPSLVQPDGSVCDIPYTDTIDGVDWPDQAVTYPSFDFLFQDGSIAPRWPTVYGFYCYDIHLKKWSKMVGQYKQLLDYLPINSDSSSPINTDNQGMLAGVLKADGYLYLFDNTPLDSYLTWGKIGYYRKGVTDLQEITFNFAATSSGSVKIDLSLDGKHLIEEAAFEASFDEARQVTVYPPYTGKWYNVTVKGKFDVSDLLTVGMPKGRR